LTVKSTSAQGQSAAADRVREKFALRAARMALRRAAVALEPARAVGALIHLARLGSRDQQAAGGERVILERRVGRLRLLGIGGAALDVDVVDELAQRRCRRTGEAEIAV